MYCSLTYFDDVAAIIASPQFAQRWSNNTTSLKWMELRKPNIIFVKALKVSLRLRQRRPNSRVKPREPRRRNRSLNLLRSHGVGHDRAARAQRLLRADGGISRGLMLNFSVELGAKQHHGRRNP